MIHAYNRSLVGLLGAFLLTDTEKLRLLDVYRVRKLNTDYPIVDDSSDLEQHSLTKNSWVCFKKASHTATTDSITASKLVSQDNCAKKKKSSTRKEPMQQKAEHTHTHKHTFSH